MSNVGGGMSKLGILLVCMILFPNTLWARQLRVELVGNQTDLHPGTIHTLVFKIYNERAHATTISPEISLPEEWRLTTALTAVSLAAQESRIYLVQVQVPSVAQPGSHEFEFILNRANAPAVSTVFELSVKPVQKITVQSISSTPYVKAGDTIRRVFVVKNEATTGSRSDWKSRRMPKSRENGFEVWKLVNSWRCRWSK